MEAIPTFYRNTRFRSRLEARWAMFFDAVGIDWEYERQGFTADGICYLPDFWLPNVRHRGTEGGVHFEVKPGAPNAAEEAKARMVAYGSQRPVVITAQPPKNGQFEFLHEYFPAGDEDAGACFAQCEFCNAHDIFVHARDRQCGACVLGLADPYHAALQAARARFHEHQLWKGAA